LKRNILDNDEKNNTVE